MSASQPTRRDECTCRTYAICAACLERLAATRRLRGEWPFEPRPAAAPAVVPAR